jgi:hypothetical protein
MVEEELTCDDLVRMIDLGLTPTMQTVNETVWVYEPTLLDWRELLRIHGFRTLREAAHAA